MLNNVQFQTEVNKIENTVFRFALKLTGDYQDARDLWQESCMRAFRYRHKYQVGANFKAWMSTIMRNLFVTNYRKRKRRMTFGSDPFPLFAELGPAAPAALEDRATVSAADAEERGEAVERIRSGLMENPG